jgi:hypothetical protein
VARRAWLAAGLVVLALPPPAAARTALLPSPTTPLDTKVPLGAASAVAPPLLPANARLASRQVVHVDVRPDGDVVRVRVVQTLTLRGTGDFFFQVQAPLRDVRATPSSQAEPGLRPTAILWQGFSNGQRVLGADAELDPVAAAAALPLRVERRGGVLVLRNATGIRARGFAAAADAAELRRVLRAIARNPFTPRSIEIRGPVTGRNVVVEAPLRVRGVDPRRFERIVGGTAPSSARVAIGAGTRVEVVAEPVPLVPEGRRERGSAAAPELVFLATRALLRLARVHQYGSFLANPDPAGPASTVYRYRIVAATEVAPRAREQKDGLPLGLLFGGLAILASGGLVVLWARS